MTHQDSDTYRLSGPRLRAIVDCGPVAVWAKDADGCFIYANEVAASLLGHEASGLIGRTTEDLVELGLARRLTTHDRRVLEQGVEFSCEEILPGEDHERVFLTQIVPARDELGAICGLAGFATEITERRRVEEHLRRSEASLTEAEHISGTGSWEWDVVNDRVRWSDGMFRLYGVSAGPTPPTYDAFLEATEDEERAMVDAAVKEAVAGVRPLDVVYRIRRPSGEVRVMHCRAEIARAPDGTALRLHGTSLDVTETERRRHGSESRRAHLETAQRVSSTGSFEWLPDTDELTMSGVLRDLLDARSPRHGIDTILTALDPGARGVLLEMLDEVGRSGERCERALELPGGRLARVVAERPESGPDAPLIGTFCDITPIAGGSSGALVGASPLRARGEVAELLAGTDPSPAALAAVLATNWPADAVELWTAVAGTARPEAGADRLGEAVACSAAGLAAAALSNQVSQRDEQAATVAVPISGGGGGVLVITAPGVTAGEHHDTLERIAGMLGTFLTRRRLRKELEHRAVHDPLTGLANRALFADRVVHTLHRMHREPHTAAVLYIDLDGLKHVNDDHGHAIGDELLRVVAERLAGSLRPDDTLARIGGDEFAVLADRITGPREALRLGERLLDCLRPLLELEEKRLVLSASIGIHVFSDPSFTPDEVIDAADAVMYEAKRAGGGRCVLADQRNH